MTVKILDLRHEQVNPFPAKRKADGTTMLTSKVIKGRTFERDPKTIDGIVVHQTACVFGPAQDLDKRNRRALVVPAHAVAFRDGTVVLPAPLSWYLYTSNGFNQHTLGLECEGQYPGLLDDLAVETFRAALTRLYEEGLAAGMPLKWLWAHRQSNGQKPSDPGQEIWQRVVLEHGVKVLGLRTRPADIVADGKPIPAAWDTSSIAPY